MEENFRTDANNRFNLYSYRLKDISNQMLLVGEKVYKSINKELLDFILKFNPSEYRLSITSDPSLVFLVRFHDSISLFVEVFLESDGGTDTYIQIIKLGKPLFQKNQNLKSSIIEVEAILKDSVCPK